MICNFFDVIKVVRQKREQDAAFFSELNQRLQSTGILKNSWAILYLLLNLSQDPSKQKARVSTANLSQDPSKQKACVSTANLSQDPSKQK